LIVDAACQLAAHGHDVHVFTSHHDKNRCFEETVSGKAQNFTYIYFVGTLVLITVKQLPCGVFCFITHCVLLDLDSKHLS
jgi:alpha-1,3/alpha-1,6-mannosyltransferase